MSLLHVLWNRLFCPPFLLPSKSKQLFSYITIMNCRGSSSNTSRPISSIHGSLGIKPFMDGHTYETSRPVRPPLALFPRSFAPIGSTHPLMYICIARHTLFPLENVLSWSKIVFLLPRRLPQTVIPQYNSSKRSAPEAIPSYKVASYVLM
jgi:hypothetical protein